MYITRKIPECFENSTTSRKGANKYSVKIVDFYGYY